jgi:restriction system protein
MRKMKINCFTTSNSVTCFKSPMPDNVFKGGFLGGELNKYIHSKKAILLTLDEVNRICSDLTKVKDSAGFFSGLQHTREIKEKYNSNTTCPKCGGELVKRFSNRTQGSFLGCSNYPRCHYIKN